MQRSKWYKKSFRRNLIDMHIEEWDERFLSKLSPVQYVENLKKAKIQTAMVYANSHVGLCNWPTENGKMHSGLKGNDFLGKVTTLLHHEKMDVVVYYSLLFDNWVYKQHPSCRMINQYGCSSTENSPDGIITGGRFGVCCPNNKEYMDYTTLQIQELCRKYKFEGMFFDMTFWLTLCHCPSCTKRYMKETGESIPEVIDWTDPKWVLFQHTRERWMVEYAEKITAIVKTEDPDITVEYNFATATTHWIFGVTQGIARAGDFAGGDLYGGISQQSFICKLYNSLTRNKPFEYMTSRCDPNLTFHTTTKPESYLEQHVFTALAHHGAFLIIDAIDPDGTIHEELYQRMGRIFSKSMKYEAELGGDIHADVGVYYSLTSKMHFDENNNPVKSMAGYPFNHIGQPHIVAALGAHDTLKRAHVPVTVLSKCNLADLVKADETDRLNVLVLPDLHALDDEEAKAIREYVEAGGNLYASGHTSHPLLNELFGIQTEGETKENFTYMKLNRIDGHGLNGIEPGMELTVDGHQVLARIIPSVEKQSILASVMLPFTDPSDKTRFVSIHSNPPGVSTDYPAILYKEHGKGKVIWTAAPIEAADSEINRNVFMELIRMLSPRGFTIQTNAPSAVEVLVFHQREKKRFVVSLVNEQEILPPIPVYDLEVSLRIDDKQISSVTLLPDSIGLAVVKKNNYVQVTIPKLEVFSMYVLDYE